MNDIDNRKIDMNNTSEHDKSELEKEKLREERAKQKEELKKYEKYGALKFQQVVFKVEDIKFKVLKKLCPNFIKHFDKYIDRKKRKQIKNIKKKATERDRIEQEHPKLLKLYDKYSMSKDRIKSNLKELKTTIRKKVKAANPKILSFYDKYFKIEDPLKGLTPEEQIRKIKEINKFSKMFMRKEFHQEKNRNYHMDSKKPTEIYKYLEWNKKVHVKGLTKDAVLIPLLTIGAIAGINYLLPILIFELVSAGINFECINIQNYNMCRFKLTEKALKKQEERKTAETIKNHGEASKVIYKSIEKNDDLPSFSEIIENISDKNQLLQLREMIRKSMEERNIEVNKENKQI